MPPAPGNGLRNRFGSVAGEPPDESAEISASSMKNAGIAAFRSPAFEVGRYTHGQRSSAASGPRDNSNLN